MQTLRPLVYLLVCVSIYIFLGHILKGAYTLPHPKTPNLTLTPLLNAEPEPAPDDSYLKFFIHRFDAKILSKPLREHGWPHHASGEH